MGTIERKGDKALHIDGIEVGRALNCECQLVKARGVK
jgi:hypothetical protein